MCSEAMGGHVGLRARKHGAVTSCLSIRRSLAQRLFLLPVHDDWRIRADACMVHRSPDAEKFRLDYPLVGYRIHVFDLIRYSRFVMRNGEGYPGGRFFGMGVLNGIFERRGSLGVGLAQL
jgi:hypothetical protein